MTQKTIDNDIDEYIVRIFKEFHEKPELAGQEFNTTKRITDELVEIGAKILPLDIKTGVAAEIAGKSPNPTIALRADIDALPVEEESGLSYKSQNAGVMHACGHDFHTAALLGAAKLLAKEAADGNLNGTVRLIFEPGEERHIGAREMIEAGAVKGIDAIFGLHNMPQIETGTVGIKSGKLMASNDNFQVNITGRGAHAAMPHLSADPIVAASNIVVQLQSIISRNVDPADRAVLTVGAFHGGAANNVIPDETYFKGTIRTFSASARESIKQHFTDIVTNTSKSFGVKSEIVWDKGPSPVDNNSKVTGIVYDAANSFMNVEQAIPTNADDDFASFEELVPGCYVFMGSKGQSNLHQSDFIANPDGLKYATRLHYEVAKKLLEEFK